MKTIVIIVCLLSISCQFDKKKTNESTTKESHSVNIDTTIIYNYILNDLIEHHIYNRYQGKKGEILFIDFIKKRIDSSTYSEKFNILKSDIVNNDALKSILYINDNFEGYKIEINHLTLPEEFNDDEIMLIISEKNKLQVDSLKSNFVLLKKLSETKSDNSELFDVGVLSLSKITFNKNNTSGMLYFEFVCGGTCGEGSLILINKINDTWEITNKYSLWEI